MMKWYSFLLLGGVLVLLDGCDDTINNKSHAQHPLTTVVSLNNYGEFQNGETSRMDISDNGRYVAFACDATNLVTGFDDDDYKRNVYLRDTWKNKVYVVSANIYGAQSNGKSINPSISAEGRYVAFESDATDLVNETIVTPMYRIYRWDRTTGETILVSKDQFGEPHGGETACINWDGTLVAFLATGHDVAANDPESPGTPSFLNLYITDLSDPSNPSPHLITLSHDETTKGDQDSDLAVSKRCFTRDGSFIFSSKADNLQNTITEVEIQDWDVFVAQYGNDGSYTIKIVSTCDTGDENGVEAELTPGGVKKTWSGGASISSDGQHIVYLSNATNLDSAFTDDSDFIDVFWKNRDQDGTGALDYDYADGDKTNTRCISRTNFHPYQSVGKLGKVSNDNTDPVTYGKPTDSSIVNKYPAITGDGSTILLISSGLDSADQLPRFDIYTHTVRKQSTAIMSFYRISQGGTELYKEDCLNGTISRMGNSILFKTDISQLNSFFNSSNGLSSELNIIKIGPN